MKVTGIKTDGKAISLPEPVSVVINQEEGVPADNIVLVFAGEIEIGDIKEIRVTDSEEAVFTGMTDVLITENSAAGCFTKIEARSLCGYLLQNEAKPENYMFPGEDMIFQNHAKTFGITKADSGNEVYRGSMIVQKGSCEWQVIEDFCKKCFGTTPRVDEMGSLHLRGIRDKGKLRFTSVGNGILYQTIRLEKRRSELVSDVFIKPSLSEDYTIKQSLGAARELGVKSVRYINAANANTPPICADLILAAGSEKYLTVTLGCAGRYSGKLGYPAEVFDEKIGEIKNLRVTKIKYTKTAATENTILTMKGTV